MSRRWAVMLAAALLTAGCADLFAPPIKEVTLKIVPQFASPAEALAGEANSLRIRIERDSAGTFTLRRDTTVTIDPETGEAAVSFSLVLITTPQTFRITLQARRDTLVLYSGTQTVSVTQSSGTGGQDGGTIQIPIVYAGPPAASIVIAPRDTAVLGGSAFTFRAAVRNAAGALIDVPVRFELLTPADSTALTVNRLSGAATAATGVTTSVRVRARTLDASPVADTATVGIGLVPGRLKLVPGFANLAAGATATVTDSVYDTAGNPLATGGSNWTSRNPSAATVGTQTGVITGVAAGSAVIVATRGGLSDSLVVVVPAQGNVVARTVPNGRSFRSARVGDTITVDVMADVRFTPSERLGSYNARLTWNQTVLTYIDVQAGGFAAPTVNDANVASGELRFGSADPTGVTGNVVIARVRFRAAQAGAATPTLTITEMSAAQTFTNLVNRVTVANGHVTVSP